jgi:hypothetical protein
VHIWLVWQFALALMDNLFHALWLSWWPLTHLMLASSGSLEIMD